MQNEVIDRSANPGIFKRFGNRVKNGIERTAMRIEDAISGTKTEFIPARAESWEYDTLGLLANDNQIEVGQESGFKYDQLSVRGEGGLPKSITIRRNVESTPHAPIPSVPCAIIKRNSPEVALQTSPDRAGDGTRANTLQRIKDTLPSSSSIAGGRVSMENPALVSSGMDAFTQFSRNQYWHQTSISSRFNTDNFSKIDIAELAELLTELSPEVSAALWYYLICCNSGYTIEVTQPGTEETHKAASEYLKKCMKKLGSYHGTLNTFFDKTFMAIFMRGAYLYEVVFAKNGKDFADIAAPDPKTLHFKRINDPEGVRGQIWDFGQYQNGEFISLDIPTVRYVPLHPLPGRIEGRAMISPVFFTAIFLMAVLRDLKRVIQQQGYMRLDLTVDFSKLKDAMPDDAEENPEVFKAWSEAIVGDVQKFYAGLEPDDAFVHSDTVTVNNPVGTANMQSLSAMDSLFGILERMAVRALKTIPALLGLNEGGDQASNNRKFEFYQKGNETIQRMVETGFEDEAKMILQAAGFQADVKLKFAQMRASEELRDLQIATLKAKLARYNYDCGYISQDEAAKYATGNDEADQEAPRSGGESLNTGGINQLQPDPGINRFFESLNMVRNPTMGELSSAIDIWKQNAPDSVKGLIEADLWNPEKELEVERENV